MRFTFTLLLSLFFLNNASAQWQSKASFPGTAKAKSTAFTIGSKVYVVGGVNNFGAELSDFWEYDIPSNTWTMKPAFPGGARYGATSFVINNLGYVATGGSSNGYFYDLWQYNPTAGTWIQMAGLPNGQPQHENQRTEAYSFVINNKAYLGGGDGWVFGANQTNNYAFFDLWEYDPATNNWIQKADIPDFVGRDMSIGVALNNKGYVGMGCDVSQTTSHPGFWEYDPLTNTWTSKADFPNGFTTDAGAFALDSGIYVVGGVQLSPAVQLSNQFYRYDPTANTWTALPNFNGGQIAGQFVVSTGTVAFAGTGYNANIVTRTDVWQYPAITSGVDEIAFSKSDVMIYPNPASENISIRTEKNISLVEVYDITGNRIIYTETSFDNIDISSLNNGIYNVKFSFKDGNSSYRQFVKTN